MSTATVQWSGRTPATCGVTMTLGSVHSGLDAGSGSSMNTSRPAPPSRPDASACDRAGSSTSPPRPTLTSSAIVLHQRELARAEESRGLTRLGDGEHDDVALGEERVELIGLIDHVGLGARPGLASRRNHAHAEAACEAGHGRPDRAQPDDAHGQRLQQSWCWRGELVLRPGAGGLALHRRVDTARQRQRQRQRVFGHRRRVDPRELVRTMSCRFATAASSARPTPAAGV